MPSNLHRVPAAGATSMLASRVARRLFFVVGADPRVRTICRCIRASRATSRMAGTDAGAAPPLPAPWCHVTTAFVQRGDSAVLLVKRSREVGTYQHQWGAISGGIEGDDESPVYRAQQEVLEEAGIPSTQLRLERSGRPLLVDDGPRRRFAVHPFLFALRCRSEQQSAAESEAATVTAGEAAGEEAAAAAAEVEVMLNWENEGYEWVQPGAIRGMDTVPLLAETYDRVNLTEGQAAAVAELVRDRQHGAAELARFAARALQQEAEVLAAAATASQQQQGVSMAGGGIGGQGALGGCEALTDLRNFGYHLATCRPSMAAIANSVAAVLAGAHEELHARADAFEVPLAEACGIVQQAALAEQRRLDSAAVALRQQTAALLGGGMTVLTTSLSSTILAAVKEAAASGVELRAIVCEARPLCEGVKLAEAWAEAGVGVTLITDAQAGLFMRHADLVLVGADAITAEAVVNKSGTYLLALAAREAGVPMWAVADTGKLSPGALFSMAHPGGQQEAAAAGHEEMGAEEITAAWGRPAPQGVSVRNVYFEDTPLKLLAGVVTEDGPLDSSGIADRLEERRQQYRIAFQLP